MADTSATAVSGRRAQILIETVSFLASLDIVARVGTCRALDIYIPIVVSGSRTMVAVNGAAAILMPTANKVTLNFNGINGNPLASFVILVRGACSNANSCNMCDDALCLICVESTRTCSSCKSDSAAVSGKCACNTGYLYDTITMTCQICDSLCSTCAGASYFTCTTCSTSTNLSNICLRGCPYGFGSCVSVSTAVINVNFNQNFQETYGIFTTGSTSTNYRFF